jgi:hypothetical protein
MFFRGSISFSTVSPFRLDPLFAILVHSLPLFTLPESSTMSDPSTSHHPRMPGRTPGNHTPRHVQWASVVDEEQIASRQCDGDLDSEEVSAHELDTAGLDVRTVCSLLSYSLVLFFTVNRLPNTYPCSRGPELNLSII